jgi:hypothetical protein
MHALAWRPDPSPQGNFPKSEIQLIAQSAPLASQANANCRRLLPNDGFQGRSATPPVVLLYGQVPAYRDLAEE